MLEVFIYCFRLGLTGFGGPLALIAQIQKDAVQEKKWISEAEFTKTLPLIKAMPGPVAWQVLLYVIRQRFGIFAAIVGGISFLLPSFSMMVLLAHFYTEYRALSSISIILDGMQVAAFILILFALKPLAQNRYQKIEFPILLLLSLILFSQGISEPLIILGIGFVSILIDVFRNLFQTKKILSISWPLFLVCFKAGALAFGTGLTIAPLLENDFVTQLQWISHQEFMDALAFGQLTPGPVVITVTFIGYKLLGLSGALLATIGIFLPSTLHMLTWFPYFVNWMSKQKWIQTFLTGALAALCAGILFVLWPIAVKANYTQIIIFVILCAAHLKFNFASWKLILFSGSLGLLALL